MLKTFAATRLLPRKTDSMKVTSVSFPFISFSWLLLTSCTSQPVHSVSADPPPNPPVHQLVKDGLIRQIPASDPRFRYEGRFDFSDTNSPVIIWQASRISLDFEGNTLGLNFDNAKGQCFFNATVDGSNTVVEIREGKSAQPATLAGFGLGRHHLVLFKRSEADAGTVCFRGVELAAGKKAWASPTPVYRLRMEFFGDSITVGACNEDGSADQWDNRRTHNAALSFAALTANAFSADYRNIAVSGMGIITGWVDKTAGQVWDKIYPESRLAARRPDAMDSPSHLRELWRERRFLSEGAWTTVSRRLHRRLYCAHPRHPRGVSGCPYCAPARWHVRRSAKRTSAPGVGIRREAT